MLPMRWRCGVLIMSLMVLGGIGLLGSLVLVVVCSGINDWVEAPLQPRAGVSMRDDVTISADYRGVTWGT